MFRGFISFIFISQIMNPCELEYSSYKCLARMKINPVDVRLMTRIHRPNSSKQSQPGGKQRNESASYILVNHESVLGIGHNASGCIGVGSMQVQVVRLTPIRSLCSKKVVKLCSGSLFVICLLTDGRCAAWGDNRFGQVGVNDSANCIRKPLIIDYGSVKIADVAVGLHHHLSLSTTYTLYSCGSNVSGAIGNGTTFHQNRPICLMEESSSNFDCLPSDMVEIACGGWHSACVSLKGELFVWGYNQSGQCANTDVRTNQLIPNRVILDSESVIKSVKCGQLHTLALTFTGAVYAFGSNECGECGQDVSMKHCTSPTRVSFVDEPAVEICAVAKSRISIAFSLRFLYIWGETNQGQEGKKVALSQQLNYNITLNTVMGKYEKSQFNYDHKNIGIDGVDQSNRILIKSNEPINVSNPLVRLFNVAAESDLVFVANVTNDGATQRIFAQKILLDRYDGFLDQFPEKFCQTPSELVTIHRKKYRQFIVNSSIHFQTLYAYLFFYHSNYLIISSSHLLELLQLCHGMENELLAKLCYCYMEKHFDIGQICNLFTQAIEANLLDIRKFCLESAQLSEENLFSLFQNREHHFDLELYCSADVDFKQKKRTIKCHRLILFANGFYDHFESKLIELNNVDGVDEMLGLDRINLGEHFSRIAIEHYVAFLYQRNFLALPDTIDILVSLLKLVSTFTNVNLQEICLKRLRSKLSEENICQFYTQYCMDGPSQSILSDLCMEIASANIGTLVTSDDFRRLLTEQSVSDSNLARFLLSLSNHWKSNRL